MAGCCVDGCRGKRARALVAVIDNGGSIFQNPVWCGIRSAECAEAPSGGAKPHWNLATDNQKRIPLPVVELSPDRCEAASDMPAGIAPFMIVKEVFYFSNDFKEPCS